MHNKTGIFSGLSMAIWFSLIAGCSFQSYQAQPLDPVASSAELLAHDPRRDDFMAYLKLQGYADEQLPPAHWGLSELTYSALYFHPDLDVSRATWRRALAEEQLAGRRRNPGIATTTEHHSRTTDGVSPWTLGLVIDIPLQHPDKRRASINQASNLTTAARIEIAETAWHVRSRLHASWIDYQAATAQIALLERELTAREEISAMIETRKRAGMATSIEVSNARLLLQKTQQALATEKSHQAVLKVDLAHHAGLSITTLNQLPLTTIVHDDSRIAAIRRDFITTTVAPAAIQESAMLNRLDIRAALARYEATEAGLRLEIARQYPDIALTPGYSYDQGDKIWSLGFAALLPLLDRNEAGIAAALAQRDLEAARFEALQAEVLRMLESRRTAYLEALSLADSAAAIVATEDARLQSATARFQQGLIDRLEFSSDRLENLLAQQNVIRTEFNIQRAAYALEEAIQLPLENLAPMPDIAELDTTTRHTLQREQP